jgi:hypothetical protein
MQTKEQFLNSLVKKEDKVKESLVKLYQGVRATNEFLGLENSPELQDTYYKLRAEEVGELFMALVGGDKVGFLDAVVDGLVVVGYELFINTNVKKEVILNTNNFYNMEEAIEEVCEVYLNAGSGAEYTLIGLELIFKQLDIDHMKAINEVLESNRSKFPTITELKSKLKLPRSMYYDTYTDDALFKYQSYLIKMQGRYVDVYHELRCDESVGEDRVIFWANGENQPDGSIKEFKAPKYVKPTATFKEPDFASCWLN